jgi:hypothetical protein
MSVVERLLRRKRLDLTIKPNHASRPPNPKTKPEIFFGMDLASGPDLTAITLFERDLKTQMMKAVALQSPLLGEQASRTAKHYRQMLDALDSLLGLKRLTVMPRVSYWMNLSGIHILRPDGQVETLSQPSPPAPKPFPAHHLEGAKAETIIMDDPQAPMPPSINATGATSADSKTPTD